MDTARQVVCSVFLIYMKPKKKKKIAEDNTLIVVIDSLKF